MNAIDEMIGVLTRRTPDAGSSLTELIGPDRARVVMTTLADVGTGRANDSILLSIAAAAALVVMTFSALRLHKAHLPRARSLGSAR